MLHRKLLIAEKKFPVQADVSCFGLYFCFIGMDCISIQVRKVKNISLFSENEFSWMVVCIQEFAVSHNVKVVLLCFYR